MKILQQNGASITANSIEVAPDNPRYLILYIPPSNRRIPKNGVKQILNKYNVDVTAEYIVQQSESTNVAD